MGVGDWGRLKFQGQLIARNEALLLFFIQRMAMVNEVLISRPMARKAALLCCFLFSMLKMRLSMKESNQKEEGRPFQIMRLFE